MADLEARDQREARLKEAWLMATCQHPAMFARLFNKPRFRDGRYLKWCLTWNGDVEWNPDVRRLPPVAPPPVQRYDVGILATTVPKIDLLRRLEDERDAYRQTLFRYRAAA